MPSRFTLSASYQSGLRSYTYLEPRRYSLRRQAPEPRIVVTDVEAAVGLGRHDDDVAPGADEHVDRRVGEGELDDTVLVVRRFERADRRVRVDRLNSTERCVEMLAKRSAEYFMSCGRDVAAVGRRPRVELHVRAQLVRHLHAVAARSPRRWRHRARSPAGRRPGTCRPGT